MSNQVKEQTTDNMEYYFVSDPKFAKFLSWEIISCLLNPISGIVAIVYSSIAHISFKNKNLDKALKNYDISLKWAKYGVYFSLILAVIIGIIVLIIQTVKAAQ